jgi:hypothetical protein
MNIIKTKAELLNIIDDEMTAVVCFHAANSASSQLTVQMLAKIKSKFPKTDFYLVEANAPEILPLLLDFEIKEIPAIAVFCAGFQVKTLGSGETTKSLLRILGRYLKD